LTDGAAAKNAGDMTMTDERRAGIGEGIRTGIGILTAFKEAIEETLEEAVERGDLSPERAKGAMRDAAHRVQSSLEEARERLDFVPRKEFDALRHELDELRARVHRLERPVSRPAGAGYEAGSQEGDAAEPARPGSSGNAGTGHIPID
jgi:polyhydroxyalkanoate synthesis regulator phasin